MNTAAKSAAAGHKTTVTSWKPSITATACGAIRPPEITTATVRPMIWMSSGRTWRGKKCLTWRWEACNPGTRDAACGLRQPSGTVPKYQQKIWQEQRPARTGAAGIDHTEKSASLGHGALQ